MLPLNVTTSLGRDFLNLKEATYNPKTGSLEPLADKSKYYAWLRSLVVCAGLSRLAYSPTDAFCRGLGVLDYAPDVINDAISVLEYNLFTEVAKGTVKDQDSYDSEAMARAPGLQALYRPLDTAGKEPIGAFFPEAGCHIVRREDKQLYVVFKGSSALKDFINDLKSVAQTSVNQMPYCGDAPPAATTGLGFWDHIKKEARSIAITVLRMCEEKEKVPTRVVVTGHSLGGATATLMSLILVNAIQSIGKAIPVACVTFGAPFVFSATGRNYYNERLKSGKLTLDRITAFDKGLKKFIGMTPGSGADVITSLGSPLVHPGYTTLNTEFYAASGTGRAFHIDEVSKVYIGGESKGLFSRLIGSGVGELPKDMEFWNGFRMLTVPPSGRRTSPAFLALLYPDAASPASLGMPAEAVKAAAVADPAEARALAEASKSVPVEADAAAPDAAPAARQRGGALGLPAISLSKAGADYKTETMSFAPNRLNFQCNKVQSSNFCHGSYMMIGFTGAIRMFPLIRIGQTPKRRKEPTQIMILYRGPKALRGAWSGPQASDGSSIAALIAEPAPAPGRNSMPAYTAALMAPPPTAAAAARHRRNRTAGRRRKSPRRQTRKVARGE